MPGEGERWTIYLDERAGEPWWRVRWPGNGPLDSAEGFRVVEVVPASRLEAAESENLALRTSVGHLDSRIGELESALTEALDALRSLVEWADKSEPTDLAVEVARLRQIVEEARSQIEGSNDA